MGFTVYYRSCEPVSEEACRVIEFSAAELCDGRTWLSCEPVCFFQGDDGELLGGSKTIATPHPDDVAEAEAAGLPDGTLSNVIAVLCELSRRHEVDWELRHDHDQAPVGFIRNGKADPGLLTQIEALGSVGTALKEHEPDDDSGLIYRDEATDEDDDDGPNILKFRPISD